MRAINATLVLWFHHTSKATWLFLGIDHKILLPSEEPCWDRSISQKMGSDSTLFGHITNVLVLCFWCGMSLRGPTEESLIKPDLPVKCIASHEILIPRSSTLWPTNYQEDRSQRTPRGKLLSLEGRPLLELLIGNVLERYEQSITREDMSSNLRAFTAGSVRHFFSLACNVDGNCTQKGKDP